MKILLLITSLMFYRAGSPSKKTYCINKHSAVQKLNESIPLFKTISDEMRERKFNNALCFTDKDFQKIKNSVFLTGEISEEYLSANFWIQNLDQLNNFNQGIGSSSELENIKFKFTSMVISLINNIFQSSILPEEDIEISSNAESNFLILKWIRPLFNNKENKNEVTISVIHEYGTNVIFRCSLKKNAHNVVRNSEPNESQEHEEAALIDKKGQ